MVFMKKKDVRTLSRSLPLSIRLFINHLLDSSCMRVIFQSCRAPTIIFSLPTQFLSFQLRLKTATGPSLPIPPFSISFSYIHARACTSPSLDHLHSLLLKFTIKNSKSANLERIRPKNPYKHEGESVSSASLSPSYTS